MITKKEMIVLRELKSGEYSVDLIYASTLIKNTDVSPQTIRNAIRKFIILGYVIDGTEKIREEREGRKKIGKTNRLRVYLITEKGEEAYNTQMEKKNMETENGTL